MSRRRGSKNHNGFFYSVGRLQKKAAKLSNEIDKFIDPALSNQQFNKLVDFNKLHEVKDQLRELSVFKIS